MNLFEQRKKVAEGLLKEIDNFYDWIFESCDFGRDEQELLDRVSNFISTLLNDIEQLEQKINGSSGANGEKEHDE